MCEVSKTRTYTVSDLRDYSRCDWDEMLDWAADEIERLQAIVDRLPKTADGVPIALCDTVFTLRDHEDCIRERRVVEISSEWIGVQVGAVVGTRGSARPDMIYSTREAAEKARKT